MSRITALLYFAQSSEDTILQALQAEQQAIEQGLRKPVENGSIQVNVQTDTALSSLSAAISTGGTEVALLHFAGHAQREGIRLQDGTALAEGIVTQLQTAGQLKFIFLNACSTISQVEAFLRLPGVVVLATSCPVADGQASYFAARFYEAFGAQRSIREAYQIAVGAMQTRWSHYRETHTMPQAVSRSANWSGLNTGTQVPWQLYYDPTEPELLDWHLPYPTINTVPRCRPGYECVGREQELEQITLQLPNNPEPLVIRGVGGTGKSTLAAAWATQHQQKYDHLLWINSTQQLLSFFRQQTSLQAKLQLRPQAVQEATAEYFVYALERLKALPGKNLIIFDNVDRQQLLNQVVDRALWQHLQFPDHWDVILTTREQLPFFRAFYLESLSEPGAKALFTSHYPAAEAQSELLPLLREIGYHALTIELLAKTLAAMSGLLNLSEVTDRIRAFRLDQEELQEPVFTTHSGQEAGVYQQLRFAFQLADIPLAQQSYLRQRALLPAEPVLLEHLALLLEKEPMRLIRDFNQLAKAGWLHKTEQSYSMHRMVQEVVLYQSNPTRDEIIPLREALKKQFQQPQFSRDERIFWALTSLPLARWAVVQSKLDEGDGFWLNGVVNALQEPIFQENVRFLLEKGLRLAEEAAEEEYIYDILCYLYRSYLAVAYKSLGQYESALEQANKNRTYIGLRSMQNILAKLRGEETDDTLNWELEQISCYSLIVRIHVTAKDLPKALAENQQMLKRIAQRMPTSSNDPRIPLIITTLTDLIQILQAEDYHTDALELSESALSFLDNHLFFTFAKAKSLGFLGRFAEAETLFANLMQRKVEFESTYSYLNAAEEYALLLFNNRQSEKALALFQLTLEQKPQVLPPRHAEIAQTHFYLALTYYRLFDLVSAEAQLRTGLTDFDLPVEKFIEGSFLLSLVLQSAERYVESNQQLEETITAYGQLPGPSPTALSCMLYKVQNALKLGDIQQARDYFQRALAYQQQHQLSIDPQTQEQLFSYREVLALE